MIKTGDLVFTRGCQDMWDSWGKRGDTKVHRTPPNCPGIVIESLVSQGGNGCQVLFGDGRTGWISIHGIFKC
jgi:hypothetical protein